MDRLPRLDLAARQLIDSKTLFAVTDLPPSSHTNLNWLDLSAAVPT